MKTTQCFAATAVLSALATPVLGALGINCRGSGLCNFAGLVNNGNVGVAQALRDGIFSTTFPNSTTYNNGDHVICISSTAKITINAGIDQEIPGDVGSTATVGLSTDFRLGSGGVCVFPQGLKQPVTLDKIKSLANALLSHGCRVCGSVPIHFTETTPANNDPSDGILTFNYVSNPICIGNCISAADQPKAPSKALRFRRGG